MCGIVMATNMMSKHILSFNTDTDEDVATPSTPASSATSDQPKTHLSPEARSFLQQLDHYVPVGCLLVNRNSPESCGPDIQSVGNDWHEVTTAHLVAGRLDHFIQDLQKLLDHGWVRMFAAKSFHIFRIYVLPGDVGHRYVDHSHKLLTRALHALVRELDVSSEIWDGHHHATAEQDRMTFDPSATLDEGSLHWMFNTLASPSPSSDRVKSHFHRKALEMLLDEECQISGLKTRLYPYQRRSAGLMLQRESEGRLELDPRLEQRAGPDGATYFYGPRSTTFLKSPRFYESSKGGILAETMGLGKTLMCVALILSTKGHLPKVPVQYSATQRRPKAGTLAEMAVASINRHSAPWKPYFEEIATNTGQHMTQCVKLMRQHAPSYEIPREPLRWNRNTLPPPPKILMLASTTIVVVPRNLFMQWEAELDKHLTTKGLSILSMDDSKKALPKPKNLALYDLILFSRPRFEQEVRDGSDAQGRRRSRYPVSCNCPYINATRNRDCTCLREDDIYDSPLKHIHFLRMIVDEGHFFTSSRTQAAQVANDIVRADHRWIVTGTPARDLLGTEMEIASDSLLMRESTSLPNQEQRQDFLQQRKDFNLVEDTGAATKSIGDLVSHFLKVRPWTACDEESSADWRQDIYRQEAHFGKPIIVGFSRCLRRTLESLVVKTRPEDVERDVGLPPLEQRVTPLKPSFYDKLTANTFAFVLTANAVTSERTDADYLFHQSSRKDRNSLVKNLRQSAFVWTGFSKDDVEATIKNSKGYLEKEGIKCSETDRVLLQQCIKQAEEMLASPSWCALSKSHEAGLFIERWPDESASFWSFDQESFDPNRPLLCGVSQILNAQAYVNERAVSNDPSEGLSSTGLRQLSILRSSPPSGSGSVLIKSGIPSSGVKDQPVFHRLTEAIEKKLQQQPAKTRAHRSPVKNGQAPDEVSHVLPTQSSLRRARITGTTSAKLSYLLSQVDKLHRDEKILIFYDDDNTAWYIAQALEIMHIGHYIYAKSLTAAKKSEYIVQFDRDPAYRVLLMDIGQAAFGLNITAASRIFFVNPVCQPQLEAQAVKRAHRIGQQKPVLVETLILEGTIEQHMLERAKRMTRAEHTKAKMLDDDGGISEIIQNVRPILLTDEEREGNGAQQIALLETPQQLWGRDNWPQWKKMQADILSSKLKKSGKRKVEQTTQSTVALKKRKTIPKLSFVDITNPHDPAMLVGAEDEPESPPDPHTTLSPLVDTELSQGSTRHEQTPTRPTSIFGGPSQDL